MERLYALSRSGATIFIRMDKEVAWLDHLTDDQWNEIRKIGSSLLEAGYFTGNQFKIAIMAFMVWTLEQEPENLQEMPNAKMH